MVLEGDELPNRRKPNRKPLVGYLILTLVVLIGFWRVEQIGQRVIETNREQDERIRAVFCLARNNAVSRPGRSLAERNAIESFYNEAMRLLGVAPCPR